MEIRKIQLAGAGDTRIISLPKDWAEKMGAEKGTSIIVRELSNGDLLLYPQDRSKGRIKTFSRIEETPDVQRDILGAYLSGFDVITVYSKKLGESLQFKNSIRELSRQLIGLEILGETIDSMELHFLIESSSLPNPSKYLKRCFSIANQMHYDVIKAFISQDSKLAEEVELRDTEVNRLYFLIVRMLKIMVDDKREESVIKPPSCLDWRMLASIAEDIGDQSVGFAQTIKKMPDLSKSLPKKVLQAIEELNELTTETMKKNLDFFMSQDIYGARKHRRRIETENDGKLQIISKEISKLDKEIAWESSAIIQLFKVLNERAIDMTDLVIANNISDYSSDNLDQ